MDDLHTMRGFHIAIDADLLLSLVSSSNSLQSLQDGHSTLDIVVERQLKEILGLFWTRYGIHVVVVLEGLRPQCLAEQEDHEGRALKMSHQVWTSLQSCKD